MHKSGVASAAVLQVVPAVDLNHLLAVGVSWCLSTFIFYYYRHCIIKMLFSLPFLYCKSFENMVTDFLFYCVSIIILF
jgi:hypothetical protein